MPFDFSKPIGAETDYSLAQDQAAPEDNATASADADNSPSVWGAAFRQSNTVGSAIASHSMYSQVTGDFYDVDRTFNPFAPENIKGYEEHADRFERVYNAQAMASVKADIDQETADRKTMAKAGWAGTGAGLVASVLDLPSLIPAGEIVGAGRAGLGLGRGVINGAVAGAVGAAVQEGGLQATQQTREVTESLANIGGGAILGGVLGGAAHLITSADWFKGSTALHAAKAPGFDDATDALHADVATFANPDAVDPTFHSVGAAGVAPEQLADYDVAGRAASAYAKKTAKLNPLLRTIQSPALAVRRIASAMMENPVYLKKNLEGEGGAAAETAVKQWNRGALASATEATSKAYKEARKNGLAMTRNEFEDAVGMAMRRGDQSNIPGVTEAAQAWRSHVFEPLKQEAIKAGLLPADVDVSTADSYFMRQWNRNALEADEAGFKAIARAYINGAVDKATEAQGRRTHKAKTNLQSERDEIQTGILRRNSNRQDRAAAGQVDLGGIDEADIVSAVRRFNNGERPAEPQSLSQWLKAQAKNGGVYDPKGDLAAVLPEGKKIPGLFRKARKGTLNANGGDGLDDIALRAWQEGFMHQHSERPSIRDFLDAVDTDVRGERIVRHEDIDLARSADDFDQMISALDRLGVDFKRPHFGTIEHLKGLGDTVGRVLDDMDSRRIAKIDEAMQAADARGALDFLDDADRADYVNGIVDDIFNTLTGRGDANVPRNLVVSTRGPLKERTFGIPDELVEKYLHHNVMDVGAKYARTMSADVELSNRFGSADMADAFDMIREEYNKLRAAVGEDTAQARKLNDQERADIRDLSAVRDMLRGTYQAGNSDSAWASVLHGVRTFNYMKSMGGVLIGSLADAARPAMVHGTAAFFKDGLGPLLHGLKGIRLAKEEARLAGAVTEHVLHSRAAQLAGVTDPYARSTPIKTFLDKASQKFTTLTGLSNWDDMWKTISARMVQNRIIRNAQQAAKQGFDSLSPAERKYMGYLGVGRGTAEDIGRLFARHGETVDGVHIANSTAWGDDAVSAAARRALYAATNKDVDSIMVTPGIGDVPLFSHTPLGKSIFQFKSFATASNQRVLLRGLQEDKTRFVAGITYMSAIGAFSYWLKQIESGQEVSNNPGKWAMEGLDRSGVFALGFEINNTMEKLGVPLAYTASSAAFPGFDQSPPASRFATRGVIDGFLGPTVGLAKDATDLAGVGVHNLTGAFTGNAPGLTPGDIGTIRRNTPFASLPYWRWAIDNYVVAGAKEAVR